MMDILNKEPLKLEAAVPFSRFPPIHKALIILDVRSHLSNTKNMVAIDNTNKEIRENLTFENLPED